MSLREWAERIEDERGRRRSLDPGPPIDPGAHARAQRLLWLVMALAAGALLLHR